MRFSKARPANSSLAGSEWGRSAERRKRSRRISNAKMLNGARSSRKPTSHCNKPPSAPPPKRLHLFQRKVPVMSERLPPHSCDTHLHIFGDAKRYPVNNPNALYQPPQDCTFEAVTALHDAMGIERAVFVQPTIYRPD